jgi:hypothetical protein
MSSAHKKLETWARAARDRRHQHGELKVGEKQIDK